jgi:transposase-like protein
MEQIAPQRAYTGTLEHDMQLAELVRPIGLVTCPNCRVNMPRVRLKESESDKKLCEATYRCPQCETETRRWIAL